MGSAVSANHPRLLDPPSHSLPTAILSVDDSLSSHPLEKGVFLEGRESIDVAEGFEVWTADSRRTCLSDSPAFRA